MSSLPIRNLTVNLDIQKNYSIKSILVTPIKKSVPILYRFLAVNCAAFTCNFKAESYVVNTQDQTLIKSDLCFNTSQSPDNWFVSNSNNITEIVISIPPEYRPVDGTAATIYFEFQ